jgi:hypothetical protein
MEVAACVCAFLTQRQSVSEFYGPRRKYRLCNDFAPRAVSELFWVVNPEGERRRLGGALR